MEGNNNRDWVLDKDTHSTIVNEIHSKNIVEFKFLYKLSNELTEIEVLLSDKVSKYGADAFILANFLTVHRSFQSTVLLLESGLQDDAIALFRSVFERIVYIKCAMDKALYPKVMLNGIKERLRRIRKVRNYPIANREITSDELDRMEENLTNEGQSLLDEIYGIGKKKYSNNDYSLETLANYAGLKEHYDYMYPVLCTKIHSDLSAVLSKIEEDENGAYIDAYPQSNDNHYFTQSIADLMIVLIECIYMFFDLPGNAPQVLYEEEKNIWSDILD